MEEGDKHKSDIIAHASIVEYIESHTKPNGGLKSFFRSNLFAALLVWILSQGVIVIGVIIAFYFRTSQMSEWKAEASQTIKRMDEWGTIKGHYENERQEAAIIDLQARMKKSEDEGRQWEVIKTEHRRLTEDVEELRHGKK